MFSRFLHIILLNLISLLICGQTLSKKDFNVYRTREGMSNNHIFSLAQDSFGYIWIATERGLNRFDGSSFQQFYSDSTATSLPDDLPYDLKFINRNEMLVSTFSGLHVINTKTLERYNLVIPADTAQNPMVVNTIIDAETDRKGNIYVLSITGFYHFVGKKLVFRYDYPATKNAQTRVLQFGRQMAQMNDKTLLITTQEGLHVYNIAGKDYHPLGKKDESFFHEIDGTYEKKQFIYRDENYLAVMDVARNLEFSIFDIRKKIKQHTAMPDNIREKRLSVPIIYRLSDILMGVAFAETGFGLMRFDRQTNTWTLDSTFNFESDFCTAFLIDKNKRLWVGTINGLYKQNRLGGHIEQVTLPGESVKVQKLITAFSVANQKLFVATGLEGIFVFDRDSLVLLKHLMAPEKDFSHIVQLIKISEDSLLSGRTAKLINTKNLEYKKIYLQNIPDASKVVELIMNDVRNNIYITKLRTDTIYFKAAKDTSFSIFKFEGLKKLKSTNQIAVDNEGNIWFGGTAGLIRFNPRSQKPDLLLDSFPSIKLQHKRIISNLIFDDKDKLYFGLENSGLIIYDIKQNKFLHVTRSHGLPDNTIRSLYLHKNKILWLATESGIASYNLENEKVQSFGLADGMPIDPGSCEVLYYDTAYGHLYAGFSQTIVRFDPDEMKKNQGPPDFFVESIDITGQQPLAYPEGSITIPYKYNNIIVHLGAINFEDAPQQLFAYRVVKTGSEPWQEMGTQRSIFFNDLSAGKHRLQVKVYIRNQSWPDQVKEITIVVQPPFWKTTWFFILCAALIAGILYYVYKRRIRFITQKANIDKQLAQTEMKALHAQMNPHFIFNCLNSIREMILNKENEQASLYLSKFARLIRITLNQSSKQFVSLTDTLDYLERYIEMEKIRSSHFTYSIDVDSELNPDDILVPPMLIQPFIENAIWHGASPKTNMNIHISFRKKENELVCIVEDNGIGIEESLRKKENIHNQPSVGIENIRQRIGLLNEKYNLHSALTISDKSELHPNNGTGTLVTLHLPIKTNESLWTS